MSIFEEIIVGGKDEDGEFLPLFSIDGDDDDRKLNEDLPEILPILPLKNTVLFPGVIIPISISRDKSLSAINMANNGDKKIAVLSQKNKNEEILSAADLQKIGVVAKVLKVIKMPDGSSTAIIQGRQRISLVAPINDQPHFDGTFELLKYKKKKYGLEFEALVSTIKDYAIKIIKLNPNIPSEATVMLQNINSDTFLLHFIASNLAIDMAVKQEILEINDLQVKAERILALMENEIKLLEIKDKIDAKVRVDIEKQQKDYFLSQQLKTIQDELGQNPHEEQIKELTAKASLKNWSENAKSVFDREILKLKRTNPQIAEYGVTLNYLELLLELPWNDFSEDNFDLKNAKKILDRDHQGLEKIKERILEYLAVLKLKKNIKSPIICLVGPPGVGKTSLGKSIANALNRNHVRISLGGLHDESEIRGHRKTYIGAMPGRIIQSLKKAKTSNPVFILDEIDKIGKDFRGDPSSALLEVLDPEQNNSFYDNYLELEYDLSNVLFIATANSLSTIQPALRDRMEIIQLSGYSVEEKIEIAHKHLITEQLEAHGLKKDHVKLKKPILKQIVEDYTRESGVRTLNRTIASVMRNVAKKVALEESYTPEISAQDIITILGKPIYSKDKYTVQNIPGVVIGLAWTAVGGDILFIEVSLSKGKGKLTLTGNLGDVMKESASSALSFIKANAEALGIENKAFDENDIHIHVPEGAVPKDGPSAGITMLSAIVSAFTKRKLKPYTAMTGEITLRGKVLPVGGIKEKVLAAKRAGLKRILLCVDNKKSIEEIDEHYLTGLEFIYVDNMMQVIEEALQ